MLATQNVKFVLYQSQYTIALLTTLYVRQVMEYRKLNRKLRRCKKGIGNEILLTQTTSGLAQETAIRIQLCSDFMRNTNYPTRQPQ